MKSKSQTHSYAREEAISLGVLVLAGIDDEVKVHMMLGRVMCMNITHKLFVIADLFLEKAQQQDSMFSIWKKLPDNVRATSTSIVSKDKYGAVPIIYGNFLCTKQGLSLSYDELNRLLDFVDQYLYEVESVNHGIPRRAQQSKDIGAWISMIESVVPTGRPNGWSPLFSSREENAYRKYAPNESRLEQAKAWVLFWRRKAETFKEEKGDAFNPQDRLPWVIGEVGWTGDPGYRHYQHNAHDGSIPIMNLCDSISRKYFTNQGVRVRYRVLYQPPSNELCRMAEHVVTRLCNGYASSGGFNGTPAGISAIKADHITQAIFSRVQADPKARATFGDNFCKMVADLATEVSGVQSCAGVAKAQAEERATYEQYVAGREWQGNARRDFEEAERRVDEVIPKAACQEKAATQMEDSLGSFSAFANCFNRALEAARRAIPPS